MSYYTHTNQLRLLPYAIKTHNEEEEEEEKTAEKICIAASGWHFLYSKQQTGPEGFLSV